MYENLTYFYYTYYIHISKSEKLRNIQLPRLPKFYYFQGGIIDRDKIKRHRR